MGVAGRAVLALVLLGAALAASVDKACPTCLTPVVTACSCPGSPCCQAQPVVVQLCSGCLTQDCCWRKAGVLPPAPVGLKKPGTLPPVVSAGADAVVAVHLAPGEKLALIEESGTPKGIATLRQAMATAPLAAEVSPAALDTAPPNMNITEARAFIGSCVSIKRHLKRSLRRIYKRSKSQARALGRGMLTTYKRICGPSESDEIWSIASFSCADAVNALKRRMSSFNELCASTEGIDSKKRCLHHMRHSARIWGRRLKRVCRLARVSSAGAPPTNT
jgi:hypothetical protein